MPRNDTWPGETGLETMEGMYSAGSCDSVVSANSGFSDDSLNHLSAEEKACLLFLEETIESLDAEEDSGLSNDEPDQLLDPGNLATKLADLSASMSKNKLNGSEKSAPNKKNADITHIQSFLVPTPFVLANRSQSSAPSVKPVSLVDTAVHFKTQFPSKASKPAHKHNQNPGAPPPVPLEVIVVVPSTNLRESSVKTAESSLPLRGPLSYDALVHLRRNASTKKTPLCPTVDHTIDKHCSAPVEGPNVGNHSKSVKFLLEDHKSKTEPPAVAPKPKKIPADIAMKLQNEGCVAEDVSDGVDHTTNPQEVRREALQKLGLLKDQEPQSGNVAPPALPKPRSSSFPKENRSESHLSSCNPMRNSQELTEHKNGNLQNSVNFHHHCRNNQESVSASHHPSQSSRSKSAGLERSVSQDCHTNGARYPEPAAKPKKPTTAQPSPDKPSDLVGYTVMVVPGMGSDRKEALRKLGLLKN